MSVFIVIFSILFIFHVNVLRAEPVRVVSEDALEVTAGNLQGSSLSLGLYGAVQVELGEGSRFLRGIEVEISAPQNWLRHRNSLALAVHNNLNPQIISGLADGTVDFDGNRIAFETLPSRLQINYHFPLRQNHGLRNSPYVTIPTTVVPVHSFPILLSLIPLVKGGLPAELETMNFTLTVRPILSDEGAVRIIPRFPPGLHGRPFTVLVNDIPVPNIAEQVILREGEHHLVILSDDYRNESRRFIVERGRVVDLIVNLQDPAPLVIFEAPQNALIFLNGVLIRQTNEPVVVEPGQHEARFQIGDYTIIRTLNVQRGRTYRVALAVDLTIQELE